MRRLLATLVLGVVIPSQVLAVSGPPPGLTATLTITAKDAVSVTLHAEQTGGDPVTLSLEGYCYNADQTAYRVDTVRFVGSADATFSTEGGTFHGKPWIAVSCKAEVWFYFSSRQGLFLAGVVTFP